MSAVTTQAPGPTSNPSVNNLVGIIESLPEKMTTAAVLRALIQAEAAGYKRCLTENSGQFALNHLRLSSSDQLLAIKHQAQAMDFVFDRLLGPRK